MKRFSGVLSAVALLALGCGGSHSSSSQGRLEVKLVDAPTDQVKQIVVTIDALETTGGPDGKTVSMMSHPVTVDLLSLQNGNSLSLGGATLPTGTFEMLRLMVDPQGTNHVVLQDGSEAPLFIPSGTESGIKLKGPFTISSCATTTITLDFDGRNSIFVHPTGNHSEWILRPVIRVKDVSSNDTCADGGIEEGGTAGTDTGSTSGSSGTTGAGDTGTTGGTTGTTGSTGTTTGGSTGGDLPDGGPIFK